MLGLKDYGFSSSSESEGEEEDSKEKGVGIGVAVELEHTKGFSSTTSLALKGLSPAPEVAPNSSLDQRRHIDPGTKELAYNAKFEDLYAPIPGPHNPFKTKIESALKNTYAGYVEPAHLNDYQFEEERKNFQFKGFAMDPSLGSDALVASDKNKFQDEDKDFFSPNVCQPEKQPSRKRETNVDPSDIEGFLGPWGKYKDEVTVSKPSEEDAKYLEEYLSKMKKRARVQVDDKPIEEKSTLHIKDPYDYQGRSFLHIPQDVGVNLKTDNPPDKCFIPKRQIHVWQGHNKGVSVIRWFPRSAHLLLSGAMDSRVKLWEVYKNRRCVRTFTGHKQAIKDACFNRSGERFLSTSYDRYIKLWDTETGECISRFSNKKVAYCVKFNPDREKQHLFVAGMADKRIICWDTRSGDNNRRFVSTSDDKSLRVWEWDIPVDMKYIADPSMHSIPTMTKSPNEKWLVGQSLDNKIVVFTSGEKFRPHKKKEFKGHMVAGYACSIDFSPDMSYIVSGDGDGKCVVWDWKTTKMVSKWKAHEDTCISALWHPHETSKVATAGWDGLIKYWD
ncbi:CDC40 [Lepeophtheirus salmonis]|uniref:CDC40 n=1 Tax=Lepeophtheirus salmonis TaxID=72036 RepID=A0A7R8CIH3_LEPSM|nr:CDC40 [Lepeophtheirus salmonis]CAF2826884.1 CDC40 [Lepeophtheirus salmonis]